MIAVTGAVIVFSTLPAARAGRSRSFARGVRRKTMRAGIVFALVGPHFIRSQIWRRVSSLTGRSGQALCDRASRKRTSIALSSMVWPMVAVSGGGLSRIYLPAEDEGQVGTEIGAPSGPRLIEGHRHHVVR